MVNESRTHAEIQKILRRQHSAGRHNEKKICLDESVAFMKTVNQAVDY